MSSGQTRKVLLVLAAFVAAAAVATPEAEPGPRGRGRGGGGQRIAEKEGRKERKCSTVVGTNGANIKRGGIFGGVCTHYSRSSAAKKG